jgi:tripartite ATP-independent transporter DctM subunit
LSATWPRSDRVVKVVTFAFIGLLLLNVPVAFVIGASTLVTLALKESVPLFVTAQRIFAGLDSFTMLAVPLFILSGALMETGGISSRLINLAMSLVGHLRGGLAQVTIVGEMFFSDISGSTSADTAAIGSIMIPPMVKAGYSRGRATAITAAACGMGMLIPPCITMVVYGVVGNASIAALFAAGIIPAVLMAAALMVQVYFQAGRWKIPSPPRATWAEAGLRLKQALLPLGMPVIIFGGILGGLTTPTEAAVIAVVYALVIGVFVYREISPRQLARVLIEAGVTSGIIMLLVGMATLLGWLLATENVPQSIAAVLSDMPGGTVVFLLLTNLIYLVLGMVLEGAPALILLVPITLPIALRLGIDPIHYGTMLIANQGIAVMMPPLGISLFVACRVGKVSIAGVTPTLVPYLLTMTGVLLLVTFVPQVSLLLPRLLGLH